MNSFAPVALDVGFEVAGGGGEEEEEEEVEEGILEVEEVFIAGAGVREVATFVLLGGLFAVSLMEVELL